MFKLKTLMDYGRISTTGLLLVFIEWKCHLDEANVQRNRL